MKEPDLPKRKSRLFVVNLQQSELVYCSIHNEIYTCFPVGKAERPSSRSTLGRGHGSAEP